ncbi:MAG TPA: hypothetical protein VFE86_17700 [Ilumatobacteraceae bacterium]|nr:hypothetical protein [Ilumatobacteraceae bacterium]
MAEHGKAARFLFGGAGLLLVFSACSDSNSPAVGGSNTLAPLVSASTTAPASGPTTVATTVAVAGTPAAVDGAALLQQAIAATGNGYHFNQTNTVDGAVALTIDGDRLPTGARLAVSNPSGLVFYVITPDGTWLMPDNGEWELDDSDPPTIDPIAALGAPSSVAVTSNDGTTVQLAVTVPAASLGVADAGDAPLQVSVVGGGLTGINYSTTTADGKSASANVVIGPAVDASPVVPPI